MSDVKIHKKGVFPTISKKKKNENMNFDGHTTYVHCTLLWWINSHFFFSRIFIQMRKAYEKSVECVLKTYANQNVGQTGHIDCARHVKCQQIINYPSQQKIDRAFWMRLNEFNFHLPMTLDSNVSVCAM